MNVTLKLSEEFLRAAEQLAANESKSLSEWVTGLMEKALKKPDADSED
jgi:predicted HicB family RNase H-like nuclease